jgi:hypothetical protein
MSMRYAYCRLAGLSAKYKDIVESILQEQFQDLKCVGKIDVQIGQLRVITKLIIQDKDSPMSDLHIVHSVIKIRLHYCMDNGIQLSCL